MKVKLIDYTQNAEALVATGARVCYSATEVDKLFDDIKDNKETQQKMIKKVIESNHMSCLEHIYFTFVIGDVSRIMSHQFVRHRLMSPHERSQRYVNLNKINDGENYCVIPDTILVNSDALCVFLDAIEEAKFAYDKMIMDGIPEEDARYVLPGATKTALIASFNGRSLIHFLRLRCCERALPETKKVAIEMLKQVREVCPTIFGDVGPGCYMDGKCPEGKMCCGKAEEVKLKFCEY